MEQIAAFILGVSIVTFIWVVVVAFRTAKLAKQNEEIIRNIEEWISRNDELVNRRIDQEIDRTNKLHSEGMSYVDSRVDKLESKILSVDKNGCEPAKKVIKG